MEQQFIGKASWSAQEDELLLSLIEKGVRRKDLPQYFPSRTSHAVRSRFDVTMRKMGRSQSLAKRSRNLAEAINALIDKMPANDVAIMLGKPHLCTPDRPAPYGTASALRELAA